MMNYISNWAFWITIISGVFFSHHYEITFLQNALLVFYWLLIIISAFVVVMLPLIGEPFEDKKSRVTFWFRSFVTAVVMIHVGWIATLVGYLLSSVFMLVVTSNFKIEVEK